MMKQVMWATGAVVVMFSLWVVEPELDVVVLQDGTRIEVAQFEVRGTSVVFVTGDGSVHRVPVSAVDQQETTEANGWPWGLPTARAATALPPSPVTQDGEGTLSVTDDGAPAGEVDIFLLANQGKQRLGTTNDTGQLPFDPALLTGKARVTVAVRECPQGREVHLVSVETDDACREAEEPTDDPDCNCEVAGAIWWGSSMSVDVSTLAVAGASAPLTSNPLFWAGTGGAAGAVAIVTATGDGDSTTTAPSSSSNLPPPATTSSATTTTTAPPMEPESSLPGMYGCSLRVIRNPSNHPNLLGNSINVDVRQQDGQSSVLSNNPNFIDVHGPFANNRQDLRGNGTYAGIPTTAEWTGTFEPGTGGRAEIQGEYAAGTNGSLPGGGEIRWRFNCSK